MLHRPPQGLDHGIRIADLDLSEDAVQLPESKKVVDLAIDVLDARVGNHVGAVAVLGKILCCLGKNQACGFRFQSRGQSPGQDSAAEIVDHRMQVRARAIEQFDDRDVDVPILIGFGRPNAVLGLGRIHAVARSKPSPFANQAPPGGGRGKDLRDSLSPQRQRTQAHVAIVLRDDQVPHVGNLVGGELSWRCMGATRTIIEGAVLLAPVPIVIPGSGQPQHPEGHGKRDGLRGVRDGVQDGALGGAVGHVLGVETETGEAHEEEGQADDGQEELDPALESEDLDLEFDLVQGKDVGGDNRALAAVNPAGGSGARHTEVTKQHGVTFFASDVAKPVVIRFTAGRGGHASTMLSPGLRGKSAKAQFPLQFHACCICDAITPGCPGS